MRVRILVMLAAAMATGPAWSQTVVSHGTGLAHDCYMLAKTGRDPRGGVDACDQALKVEVLIRKDRAATYDNRGVMLDVMGRADSAESDFARAIALEPSLGDPYVNLGSMLIKKRQAGEALDSINKGLSLGMSFPYVGYYDRALAEEMLGRYSEAYYDYKKVLELEPHYAPAEQRLKDFIVTTKPAAGGARQNPQNPS